jgi:hypothetical protein
MKELSTSDIQKIQDSKKVVLVETSTRNPALFRYLSTNTSLNDRLILNDPMSNTYVQLYNNDGSLEVVSQYLHAQNLTIDGLSVFNNATVQNNLKSRGQMEASCLVVNGSTTMKNATITENLTISGCLVGKLNVSSSTVNIVSSGPLTITSDNCVIHSNSMFTIDSKLIQLGNESSKINIGTNGKNEISIGSVNSLVNIYGTMNYVTMENMKIANREIFINSTPNNRLLSSVKDVGIFISNGLEEKAGYIKSDSELGNRFIFKPPFGSCQIATPKLTSNSTFIVSNDSGLVSVEQLDASSVKTKMMSVTDGLVVAGNVSVKSDVFSVGSNISTSGSASVQGELSVAGEASIGKNTIGEDTVIGGTFNVMGSTRLSDVYVDGPLYISGSTKVINDVSIDGCLDVSGGLNVSNGISVEGDVLLDSSVVVSGLFNVNDKIIVDSEKVKMMELETEELRVSEDGYVKNLLVEHLKISGDYSLENMTVSGFAKISHSLSVDKNANVGMLNVSGNANFNNSNVVIDGGLKVTRRGILVNGMSVFNSMLTVQNGLQVLNKGASITGDTKLNNANVSVSGSLQLLGDFFVTGNVRLTDNVVIGGGMEVNGQGKFGDISVLGDVIIGGDNTVSGSERISGDLDLVGSGRVEGSLTIQGETVHGDNVSVSGNLKTRGRVEVGENLDVGRTLRSETMIVGGSVEAGGLVVRGDTVMEGSVAIGAPVLVESLGVSGGLSVGGELSVSGSASLEKLGVSEAEIFGDVTVGGEVRSLNATIVHSLTAGDIATTKLNVANSVTIGDSLVCNLPAELNNGIVVSGGASFVSDLVVDGSLHVGGKVSFGDANVAGAIVVSDGARIGGNAEVNGGLNTSSLRVDKCASLGGSLSVSGSIRVGNSVQIGESGIMVGNVPLATQEFVKATCVTYNYLTLDNSVEMVKNIEDGVYTYMVNNEKVDTFEWLGEGVNGQVNCMVEDMENNIYVGGSFKTVTKSNIESNYLAKWDSKSGQWVTFGTRVPGQVQALLVNRKNEVYIAGVFAQQMGTNLLRYNAVEDAFTPVPGFTGFIKCLAMESDESIYVGGVFDRVGDVIAYNLARIDADSGMVVGIGLGQFGVVTTMVIDREDNLYISGGSKQVHRYQLRDEYWTTLNGSFNNSIMSLAVDSRDNLYVGGRFTGIQMEDGSIVSCRSVVRFDRQSGTWMNMGEGLYPDVKTIVVDVNDVLYATTTTIQPLFRYVNNRWNFMDFGISGQISSMLVNGYNHLLIGGNNIIAKYYSKNKKTMRFHNTIKVTENGKLINCRKIRFGTVADTITIKFVNRIGYITYKSGNIECL